MTDGQNKLQALLVSGVNAQDVAHTCGVAQPLVLAWAQGKFNPDPVSRAVLELDYKILAVAWK